MYYKRTYFAQFVIKLIVEITINKAVVGSWSWGLNQICGGGCGIAWDTQHSGCTIAMVLLSVYGHFRQFWGGCASDVVHPKRVILFANVTLLKGAVMSYVMSQHCMCIGHVSFYYKRSTDASVGGSCPLFIHSSGLTLSPETCMWLVPNVCRSDVSSCLRT